MVFTGGNLHSLYQLLKIGHILLFIVFAQPCLGRPLSRNGSMCKRNNFIRFEPRCQLLQERLSLPTISRPSFTGKLLNNNNTNYLLISIFPLNDSNVYQTCATISGPSFTGKLLNSEVDNTRSYCLV